jgi:hypothetical protein
MEMENPPRAWWRSRPATSRRARAFALAQVALALASCAREPDGSLFTDITARSGIQFTFVNGAAGEKYVIEIMLGGIGWVDYDGDGDYDLYLVNAHSDPLHGDQPGKEGDKLYRNDGNGRFTDVTREAGIEEYRYGSGLAVGDFDNDGDSDILVTNYGRNTLYRNEGGKFTDVTEEAGLGGLGYSMGAVWFDMDRDGDLDLYVARYVRYNPATSKRCKERDIRVYCNPKFYPGDRDLLYENIGGGKFKEIGRRAGIDTIEGDEGRGLGVVAFDQDRDGFTDVYVANDMNPNFLWHNNGDGTFTDVAQEAGVALSMDGMSQAGMGVDVGDVDRNGITDIYVCNFAAELNNLYRGEMDGHYVESSVRSGLGATYQPLGFGTLLCDLDLDGDVDMVTANGHINDLVEITDPGLGSTFRQRPSLFLGDGSGKFKDAAGLGGHPFSQAYVGRGLARSDLDGDGDLDLAMMTLDRSLVLLRNENPMRHRSLTVKLVGTRSSRDAYGARLEALVGGKLQAFEYHSTRSYLSASDPRVVIGLGKDSRVEKLKVYWPSGRAQELSEVPADGAFTIREPE